MLKQHKVKELLIEKWLQCDSCKKWRKITDDRLYRRLEKLKKLLCKDIPGSSCRKSEDYWDDKHFVTINNNIKV